MSENRSKTFKQSMDRLQAIVAQLNQQDVELENAMALFVEGSQLVKDCQKQLAEFDAQVQAIKEGQDENL